jgi:two-component system OmpR family sensor kinase/two-component system sensor histidine kinase BaeS
MNRLWVRLSFMISGVLFLMFFMQFLAITLEQTGIKPDLDGPPGPPPAEIQRRLFEFMAFSIVVGTGGGIVIGRVISAPISQLARAAHQIGKGELAVRVPVRGSHELVELAETFNKMAADLQHAETLRTNLMADVSHELRTPLTVLEGNLRAALDRVVPLDEAEIANLYGQTRHLIRLVNDLRELSLAESGQLPLEKVPTDLNALVAETLQALEPLAAEKDVRLADEVPTLPEVTVDPFRLRQVLFNLLTNALRHTPQGGKITFNGETGSGEVVLRLQDTGEGLEPAQLSAVFDRFYRADKSRSRETGGTGLGLAIVKAIVEAHGGRVEVHSAGQGQGCQFLVRLPLTA